MHSHWLFHWKYVLCLANAQKMANGHLIVISSSAEIPIDITPSSYIYMLYLCTDPSMSGGHSYTHEMLEQENDQLVNTLSDKVAALKSVSSYIRTHAYVLNSIQIRSGKCQKYLGIFTYFMYQCLMENF